MLQSSGMRSHARGRGEGRIRQRTAAGRRPVPVAASIRVRRPDDALEQAHADVGALALEGDQGLVHEPRRRLVVPVVVPAADRVDLVGVEVGDERLEVLEDGVPVVGTRRARQEAVEVHAAQPAGSVGRRLSGRRREDLGAGAAAPDVVQALIAVPQEHDVLLRHPEDLAAATDSPWRSRPSVFPLMSPFVTRTTWTVSPARAAARVLPAPSSVSSSGCGPITRIDRPTAVAGTAASARHDRTRAKAPRTHERVIGIPLRER